MISIKKWVLFTFLGWLLGIVFILFLSGFFDSVGIENLQFYVGLGVSAGVALMQWLVLRKINMPAKWVLYSILAISVPFLVFDLVAKFTSYTLKQYYLPVNVIIGGLVVSILQAKLLKPFAGKTNLWVGLSFSAWVLAVLAVFGVEYTKYISGNNLVLFFLNLILILIGGVILGVFTGSFLQKNLNA